MKGISRRTRACAVVAVTGVAVLATAGAANAQRPASTGDGIPTGQASVQMFNYGGYISSGGNTGAANPINPADIKPASDGSSCLTSVASGPNQDPQPRLGECQRNRVEALFAFLQRKGVTSIEMFGHADLPGGERRAGESGLPRAAGQVRPARRRPARQPRGDCRPGVP